VPNLDQALPFARGFHKLSFGAALFFLPCINPSTNKKTIQMSDIKYVLFEIVFAFVCNRQQTITHNYTI
jgi:hypothetical protein